MIADGSRYRAAYFGHEWADGPDPSTWRHGDWVTLTERGSLIIHGRSDATLNRHGIRMGSADIYDVVEALDGVSEAFIVGVDGPDGAYWMPLFVTLPDGSELDDALTETIRSQIRSTAVAAPRSRRRSSRPPASRTPAPARNSRCRSRRSWPATPRSRWIPGRSTTPN